MKVTIEEREKGLEVRVSREKREREREVLERRNVNFRKGEREKEVTGK